MMAGGSSSKEINSETRATANNLVMETHAKKLLTTPHLYAEPSLIYYATQVVNGTNHRMIYKTKDSNNHDQFVCTIVYQALGVYGGKTESTKFNAVATLKEACDECGAVGGALNSCLVSDKALNINDM